MRALVIQHDHVSPPGLVGERLVERGYDLVEHQVVPEESFFAPGVETEFPDPREFDLVVPMGSPWPVYDTELIGSWVKPEMELLREADEAGVPVLGLCFGGQLLAATHGGRVERGEQAELGWVHDIVTDDPALVPQGPWFEWHYDRWHVPPGAKEVARNDVASQAFVLRRNLALQFHPELDPAMLEGWLTNGGADELERAGLVLDEVRAVTEQQLPAVRLRTHALVDAFLERVAAGPLT
ncbi:type 1 glutamine amidotransferase [Nocardioides caldifontis]|uniref:type 1 glutamine amidotransferase n=1 Tax=Nocardioides caldifontis TaxID=2588938 RepID=UPI0011DF08B1|nr:gamma-glutamyl-gamma-aminobutyrate hydrolase family protein [Nocardioides caldifontis]